MPAESPPKPTVLVLTTLIVVIGGLGTAAIFSNIEPAVKAWLVGAAYLLVTIFALTAIGTMTSALKRFELLRFNNKLRQNYARLRILRPFVSEVEKIDTAYRNLLSLFLADEANRRNQGQKGAYGIGLLNSTRDASTKV